MKNEGLSLQWADGGDLIVGRRVSVEAARADVERKRAAAEARARLTKRDSGYHYLGSIPIPVAHMLERDHGLNVMHFGKFSAAERQRLAALLRTDYAHLIVDKKSWR